MVEPVDPLQRFEKMTNEDGTPSDYFIRQWQNLISLVTSTETNETSATTNATAITALQAITLTAGTGLEGGGDLSADRTFAIEDTAVSAGSFGSATQVGTFTVNAQGQLTAAANVTISGSGGGGLSWVWPEAMSVSNSSSSFAFKGALVVPHVAMTISSIAGFMNLVSGATYRTGVYRLDGSDNIDEITGVSSDFVQGSTVSDTVLRLDLTSDASLTAGSRYAVVIGRTDAGDTHGLPITFGSLSSGDLFYPSVPTTPFSEGGTDINDLAFIAQATPAIGDAVLPDNETTPFGLGFEFTLS